MARSTVLSCALSAVLLLLAIPGGTRAGTIYKCVAAGAAVTYQDKPCAAHARQAVMSLRQQPLIDDQAPAAPPVPRSARASSRKSRTPVRARGAHRKRAAHATSWECRAADGEVFYRHSRCPHSVPGDGVMRSGGTYLIRRGSGRRSSARSAWSPVSVHAHKVSRALACSRINAVAAVERDGSARDEHASAYEHDLGRDPCAGY